MKPSRKSDVIDRAASAVATSLAVSEATAAPTVALTTLGLIDAPGAWATLRRLAGEGQCDAARWTDVLAWIARAPMPARSMARLERFIDRLPPGAASPIAPDYATARLHDLMTILGIAPELASILERRPDLIGQSDDTALPVPAASVAEVRSWFNAQRLIIGGRVLTGRLAPELAGPVYTGVAEQAIDRVFAIVQEAFRSRHGVVDGGRFAVLGLGKLGGREMTDGSDLDLVLIYDVADIHALSDGPRPLPAPTYFARLGERLVGALTARAGTEGFYAIDLRLRPWAAKSAAAVNFVGFRDYFKSDAWTWEFMALTRARPIAGDPSLMRAARSTIGEALCRPRDPQVLRTDVDKMRRSIAANHQAEPPWDVKRRTGGLVDCEFILQYLMLRHAAAEPGLLAVGSVDALAGLTAAGHVSAGDAEVLGTGLALWTRLSTVLRLIEGGWVDCEMAKETTSGVLSLTDPAFPGAALNAKIEAMALSVSAIYRRVLVLG
jgi:glutamate-ammonia-ligase adenylyltransferase